MDDLYKSAMIGFEIKSIRDRATGRVTKASIRHNIRQAQCELLLCSNKTSLPFFQV